MDGAAYAKMFDALRNIFILLAVLVVVCSVGGFALGRYVFPEVPPEVNYCEAPAGYTECTEDLEKCGDTLMECDVAYASWKTRAEECQALLADIWVSVPNYRQGDSDVQR